MFIKSLCVCAMQGIPLSWDFQQPRLLTKLLPRYRLAVGVVGGEGHEL